jgi:hypothetical protein
MCTPNVPATPSPNAGVGDADLSVLRAGRLSKPVRFAPVGTGRFHALVVQAGLGIVRAG